MTLSADASAKAEFKKIEQKNILDIRTFLPCHVKEVEQWSWRKFRHEKWMVHLVASSPTKLKMWKVQ